jgi:hypothetical protein
MRIVDWGNNSSRGKANGAAITMDRMMQLWKMPPAVAADRQWQAFASTARSGSLDKDKV